MANHIYNANNSKTSRKYLTFNISHLWVVSVFTIVVVLFIVTSSPVNIYITKSIDKEETLNNSTTTLNRSTAHRSKFKI